MFQNSCCTNLKRKKPENGSSLIRAYTLESMILRTKPQVPIAHFNNSNNATSAYPENIEIV